MNTKKKIIRAILKAQVASDAGKGIPDYGIRLPKPDFREAVMRGYEGKVVFENAAITLIRTSRPCGINYWVSEDLLVYFDIKHNGRRFQICSSHELETKIGLRGSRLTTPKPDFA